MQVIPELSRGVSETVLHSFLTLTFLDGVFTVPRYLSFRWLECHNVEIIIFFAVLFSI